MTEQTARTLELVKVKTDEATYKRKPITLPTYDVVLDGAVIGRVKRTLITRERRTPGNRYVDARWQSPGWRYELPERSARHWGGLGALSRRDGIERILRAAGLGWTEAEDLAETVQRVR